MTEETAGAWKLTRLIADEEIAARMFQQCCLLQPEIYLAKEIRDLFRRSVAAVMTKLERSKYHSVRCRDLAQTAVTNAPTPRLAPHMPTTPQASKPRSSPPVRPM